MNSGKTLRLPRAALSAGAMLAALAAGAATTRYVGPAGSDDNAGDSPAAALATIQRAVDRAAPGDAIVVLPGTYAGARIERSGASNAWIRLRADPAGTALLDRPGPVNRHRSILEMEGEDGAHVVAWWEVSGFTVSNSPKYGLDLRSTDHIAVRSNAVWQSRVTGIFAAFSYDLLVEGNVCAGNGEHGIYVNNSSDRFVVRGNRLFGNRHCGLHLNGDASCRPPAGSPWEGDGVMSDGLIADNVIFSNGKGGAGINLDGVTRTLVRNNLLYDTPNNSGIALFRGDAAAASCDNEIVNNTVVMSAWGGWALTIAGTNCVGNRVRNNVFITRHAWRGSIALGARGIRGLECDFNALSARFSTDDGETTMGLREWRRLGYDGHSVVAQPADLFAGSDDFRLRPGSVAVDRGTAARAAARDLDGRPRPVDGNGDGRPEWDIGAFEYQPAGR